MEQKTPLSIGLRAARANLIPGLIIQGVMLAVVLAFYFWTPAAGALQKLAETRNNGGFWFTIIASLVAGALVPEILTVAIFQRGKIRRENLEELLFLSIFWTINGVCVDFFYRAQGWLFGYHADFFMVLKKVLLDQLVYTPFFATPFGMFCYEWRNQNYIATGLARTLTIDFYRSRSFPALIASWGVWFPVVAIIYSLPAALQFPLFSLALTFWVLMFSYINAKRPAEAAVPAAPVTAAQEA